MIRVLGSLLLAGTVAYWTIGWATLRLLHDGLAWDFRSADRAALAAVLIATPLL